MDHGGVDEQEGAQRLEAGDEVGGVALVREEQRDECRDEAEGYGCSDERGRRRSWAA